MTHDEYHFLKNWDSIPLKRQHSTPMPANALIETLVDSGSLVAITRIDSSTPSRCLIVGYELTDAGKSALKQFEFESKQSGP